MKYLKILLTALMLLCTTAATAQDFELNGLHYYITSAENKTVEVNGSGNNTGTVKIPRSVTYNGTTYSVTEIGNYAFKDCVSLTGITIPNSIKSIRGGAFTYCI